MTGNLAVTVLALLAIVVSAASAFRSNAHEIMTAAEIFETFGTTEDSIPDYHVYPITMPGSRRKREAMENIQLKIRLEKSKQEIELNFKPSSGHLASKYTPVWSAVTDEKAFKNIRYDPLPTAMTDIGDFKMYHDWDWNSAIVVYEDPEHDFIIEGIATPYFAIKSLPKRLMGKGLRVGKHLVVTRPFKRSIDNSEEDEVTHYLAVYEIPSVSENIKRSVPVDVMANHRIERSSPKLPEAVYPEILLILDHNAIRNHTITQALRFMLAFWNGVDMVYSALEQPFVRLNIAGIIIAADDKATPYITDDTSKKILPNNADILDRMGSYFYEERVRFPFNHYDMIIAMSPIKFCKGSTNSCEVSFGAASLRTACTWETSRDKSKRIFGTGVSNYEWNFAHVDTAVHETAHLLGVHHDGYSGRNYCSEEEGFVMSPYTDYNLQSFTWSKCSLDFFRKYFSSKDSMCLDNKPLWMEPVEEILPGRWLTLDGQCRNSGFVTGCKIPKISICLVKGCRAENSEECAVNEISTLQGTACGDKKFCNSVNNCVEE